MVETYCEMSATMQELVDLQEEITQLESEKEEKKWDERKARVLEGKKSQFEKVRIRLGF
ncbi:MAG: hypothetical protein WC435_04025 [Candidatus Paceibacterota bacterium]